MPQREQDKRLLCAMALNDPDFAAYAADLPPAMGTASQTLPPALVQDVITVLREEPETAQTVDNWRNGTAGMKSYSLTGGAVTIAVTLFLLRSHIRIHRRDNGSWELLMESKPNQGSPVADAISRILDWLRDSGMLS